MKYSIPQKSHESIFTGSCVKLTSAGSTTACHSSYLTTWCERRSQKPAPLALSMLTEVGCYWCLEQLWSYPLYWVANWKDASPLLRRFPDICTVKEKLGFPSEAFWNFSASTDFSSTWLTYATGGQQDPLAVVGAMPKDKCSPCLGCSLAAYIQAKCHGAWLK